jgi:putative endonuclease
VVRERLMYTVYVLKSLKDGKQYTGSTEDLERRLKEHNAGKTASTRRRRPFVLVHTEEYESREAAEDRERYLKTGKGREELKKLLIGAVPHPPAAGKSGKGEVDVYGVCSEEPERW